MSSSADAGARVAGDEQAQPRRAAVRGATGEQPAAQVAAKCRRRHRALALQALGEADQFLGRVGLEVGSDVAVGGHLPPSSGDRGFRLLALRSDCDGSARLAAPRVDAREHEPCAPVRRLLVPRRPWRQRLPRPDRRPPRARARAAGAASPRMAARARPCGCPRAPRRSVRRPRRRGCRGWPARPPSGRPRRRARRRRAPQGQGAEAVERAGAGGGSSACGGSSRPATITAASAITTQAIAPISQTHSNAAAVMNVARPPTAAAIQIRIAGAARTARTTATPEQEREQADQQREADDPRLGERLEVQRVGVADEAGRRAVARPPELERSRADALHGVGRVGVQRRLPVLVAPVAVGALQAAEDVVLGAACDRAERRLELLPAIVRPAGSAGRCADDAERPRPRPATAAPSGADSQPAAPAAADGVRPGRSRPAAGRRRRRRSRPAR